MADFDCLLVGHNELDFQDYCNILENMASSGGRDHVAFTDLQFNHIEIDGHRYQAQDALAYCYNEELPEEQKKSFYNGDCLWSAIPYLGTYLKTHDLTFDYINLFQEEKEDLKKKLTENNYTLIALTGTMYVFEQNIWEVVNYIRRIKKDVKIIAGGPYISKQAEEREPEYLKPLFKYLNADFYCYSREGEQTLVNLLKALKAGESYETIPNIAYKSGRQYVVTPPLQENNPLKANRIDYSLFADAYGKSGWANVRISDGCPYACAFCSFPEHGNEKYIVMNLENIERELDAIKAAGTITHLFFVDATLNVPKTQFKEMLRMMIRKEYGFKWHCFFRCDQMDEDTVSLMKDAGCMGVFLGLESASEIVLKNMDKSAVKEDFRFAMPLFKKYGIKQMVSVQVGYPGETYETYLDSLNFLEEIAPDFARIQIWFCDTTTPIWRKREQFGLEGKGYGWSHDTMDAETAVKLVAHSFFALKNTTWVPDPGFNWVSFYILEKKGFPIERQKKFLDVFGSIAKEKLISPKRQSISERLLLQLKQLGKFDSQSEPKEVIAEGYDVEIFRAAEAYWRKHINENLVLNIPAGIEGDGVEFISSKLGDFDFSKTKELADRSGLEIEDVILTIYAIALSKLQTGERISFFYGKEGKKSYPLAFDTVDGYSFTTLAQAIVDQKQASEPYGTFAPFLFEKGMAKALHLSQVSLPYMFIASKFENEDDMVLKRISNGEDILEKIKLCLCLNENNNVKNLELHYVNASGMDSLVEKVISDIYHVIENVSEKSDVLLGEVITSAAE